MKLSFINATRILLIAVVAGTLFSCVKKTKEPSSTRQTLVKIVDGGTPPTKLVRTAANFVTTPQVLVVDLRRDANDEAELFTTMTVVVKDDTAAVTAADPNYTHLPADWYTIQSESPKVGGMGGTFTFVFKPGEFAKEIFITIPDASLLDPNALYALAFTITSVDNNGRISASKSRIFQIGETRNKYDGKYYLKGRHNRSPYTFPYIVEEMHLVTVPDTDDKVYFYWPEVANTGHPIGIGPDPINDVSWYGNVISPEIEFDANTNLVTDVYNRNVAGGVPVVFQPPPVAPVSRYDPATKTVYVYFYYYTGAGQDFSNRGWSDTLIYTGPR